MAEAKKRIGANGRPTLGRRKERPCTWDEALAAVKVLNSAAADAVAAGDTVLPVVLNSIAAKLFMEKKPETKASRTVRNALWQLHDKGYIGRKPGGG